MRAIIVIVLLVCCLAGWWTFSIEPVAPPSDPADNQQAGDVAGHDPLINTASMPVEASVNRDSASVSGSVVENKAPAIPDDAEWLEVCIVDRETGEAIANADVWWHNQMQWELIQELSTAQQIAYRDDDRRAREYGWYTRSDADGLVKVTLHQQQVQVIAEKEGRYGRGTFDSTPPPRDGHRVKLEPDLTLRVRVWSAAHEPAAGVPLAMTEHNPANGANRNFWWWDQNHVDTDKEGLAEFAHVQLRQRRNVNGIEQPVPQWLIHVRSPGLEVEPVAVDAQAPPTEPVEVQLPATGQLRVRVMSGGKPWHDGQLMLYPSPKDKGDSNNSWMVMAKAVQRTPDVDGWLEHRHVGLGQSYTVGSHVWSVAISGPTLPDEVATATVNIDEHAIVLIGRLLQRDGQPIVRKMCMLSMRKEERNGNQTMFRSKDDGTFWHALQPGKDGAALDRMRLEFRWDPKDGEGQMTELAPRVLHVGRTDLGDIRLQAATLIVSGRVVANCERKGNCSIYLQHLQPSRQPGGEPRWRSLHQVNVQIADDLSFAAYGTLEPGRYRLQVYGSDYVRSDPIEFVPGARDLRIDVTCGNRFSVHCLLPEPLTGSHLQVRLLADADKKIEPGHISRAPGEADYNWNGLADGTYALEFRPDGWGRAVAAHRIEGIQLPFVGDGDGRFPDVDLRSVLSVLHLEIALADGRQDNVTVFVMPQQEQVWQGAQLGTGKSMLPVAMGPHEVLVAASGYEAVTVQGAQGSVSVTLERRAEAHIQVFGLDGLPADCYATAYAKPRIKPPIDERRYQARWNEDRLASLLSGTDASNQIEDGAVKLQLNAGAHELRIRLSSRSTSRSQDLEQITPAEIASAGSFQVQVSSEELARVLAVLAKPLEEKK